MSKTKKMCFMRGASTVSQFLFFFSFSSDHGLFTEPDLANALMDEGSSEFEAY